MSAGPQFRAGKYWVRIWALTALLALGVGTVEYAVALAYTRQVEATCHGVNR